MRQHSNRIEFTLPGWLENFYRPGAVFSTVEERMEFVIEASRKNIELQTGGPFAAGVFESQTGKIVSLGVNLVATQKLSILHAEIVATSIAQQKLNTFDLGALHLPAHELVISSEPCAMCFGAIPWSGVTKVITGATGADVRAVGFDEGAKPQNWIEELTQRQIEVITELKRSEANEVLQNYKIDHGVIYNSRALP